MKYKIRNNQQIASFTRMFENFLKEVAPTTINIQCKNCGDSSPVEIDLVKCVNKKIVHQCNHCGFTTVL